MFNKIFKTILILIVFGLIITYGFWIYRHKGLGIEFLTFLTFLAILWYSWETKKLREEAISQKHLNVYPLLVVQDIDKNLFIINIGRGPALKWKINFSSHTKTIGTPKFLYSRVLPPIKNDPEAKIPILSISIGETETLINGKIVKNSSEKETSNSPNTIDLTIEYFDIYNKKYISKIKLTPVGPYLEDYIFE